MDASAEPHKAAAVGPVAPPAAVEDSPVREPSIWHRPVSYRAQCWVAWTGLTAFGVRGALAMWRGEGADVERIVAIGLSVAWGIDLLRDRSSER